MAVCCLNRSTSFFGDGVTGACALVLHLLSLVGAQTLYLRRFVRALCYRVISDFGLVVDVEFRGSLVWRQGEVAGRSVPSSQPSRSPRARSTSSPVTAESTIDTGGNLFCAIIVC